MFSIPCLHFWNNRLWNRSGIVYRDYPDDSKNTQNRQLPAESGTPVANSIYDDSKETAFFPDTSETT